MMPSLTFSEVDQLMDYWWGAWMGMHWGFRRHASVYWACSGPVAPEKLWRLLRIDSEKSLDVILFYRELVVDLISEIDLTQRAISMTPEPERKNIRAFYAGRNVFQVGESFASPISRLMNPLLADAKLPKLRLTDDGEDSRIASFRMVFESMRRANVLRAPEHPRDKSESPLLFISESCPRLIATIPSLEYDPQNREDVKRVGTVQDDIWQACMNTFVNYRRAQRAEPLSIQRMRAIAMSDDPMGRRFRMLDFDSKNKIGPRMRRR